MSRSSMNPAHTVPDETQRRGQLVLRTLPILLIPLAASAITWALMRLTLNGPPLARSPVAGETVLFPVVPIVVMVIFFSALIILVRLGRPTISALVLIGVWTLFITLASLRFGVVTYFPALLILPICAAGLLIDGAASVSLAGLATLLVASIAWLESQGWVPPDTPAPDVVLANIPALSVVFWAVVFWSVAALTRLLAGGLQQALLQSRSQAEALQSLSDQLEVRVAEQTTKLLAQSREAATLEERTRLAREIHDTLAQGLTGVVVQLGAAQRALTAGDDEGMAHLDLATQMARESLAEARRSVWNLRAPALARGELSDALRGLAARPLSPHTGIYFEQRGESWPLAPAVESALLRVCQEALANVGKHADANRVDVVLEFTPQQVCLRIRDDGVGFDETTLTSPIEAGPWGGFGLLGMKERLSALGGYLELGNDDGAEVVAVVPRKEDKE